MTRAFRMSVAVVAMTGALMSTVAFAQTPPPVGRQTQAGRAQRPARPGGRAALPPAGPNMTPQQLQAHIDAYALVQAERELQLTNEQYPNFVGRLRRLQEIRRRHLMERRKLMQEIRGLLAGDAAGRDERITERLRALQDAADTTAADLRKAYQDMDAVLTPWQRGRFRLFEDELERRKIELLAKIGGGA